MTTIINLDTQEYRENMEFPMEELADTLSEMGMKRDCLTDPELVTIATRKLKTLRLIAATVMNEDLLKAVMAE